MEDYKRTDPDVVLMQIQKEDEDLIRQNKGRLKIFLGYCAGVGKTYRMLQDGALSKKNSIDVAIGIAETHGRKETEALLAGLECIPRKKIAYSGLDLEEVDIDRILSRAPQLVLMDELAHTNVPGSRHSKRYQDIEELINAGIDVFTTLNIQHVESIVDIVSQTSGIKVYETVPDSFLALADEIELVDLTPEKLLERLKEGKVYIPQKAQLAMQKFFRMGNLLALRELSLRYTAKQVDEDMQSYMEKSGIIGPWPVGSKLLVSISGSPSSERLLRITHRMASDLNADWYAVYVDSPQQTNLDDNSRNQLEKNILLATELCAKVFPLSGTIIADEIIHFARQKNVTLIIAGLSHRSRIEELFKGSVINELVRKSSPINVLIVGSESYRKTLYEKYKALNKKDYKSYLASCLSVAIAVGISWPLRQWLDPANIGMLLLFPVIASSVLWGTRVGLFTSAIAISLYDFFFIPPFFTFSIGDYKYLPGFLVFIAIALINSFLAKMFRWQYETSHSRERFLSSLYTFSREMMMSKNVEDILSRSATNISEAFSSDAVIFVPDADGNLTLATHIHTRSIIDEAEKAIAVWVYKNGQPAGRNTRTLSSSMWYFLPMNVKESTIGVVGIRSTNQEHFLTADQIRLLESFASMVGLALANH
ncbi:MAG: sensor histidine kinase KdpD [Candidatus Margulisiibacteriota bacterium]|nr:MAG: hypothetical protein A2X43_12645 [Candidatus Margulisbacteria bacterium GWD2_39_127]OGI02846.1 MAG: hypothetical protein A2X42_02105 [Candidatus Margulisbacteria bacterium GWF2_38_17]OGI09627.1 MAG: hypothetical protein A2X41_04815 [Candidatus Margulisbacteria bacterium GWE2_39_32]PZM83047.1 MAG: sensor histidine kinase KdpD [Candidatus Margulisiibacteriota bacterium]HAR63665.1 sensor histidine kinase KdpD [Candidatus Margulisiibacteriota bacterium]